MDVKRFSEYKTIMTGLFCYYLFISFKEDSAAQAPEKLYREKELMIFVLIFCLAFILLLKIDIPMLLTTCYGAEKVRRLKEQISDRICKYPYNDITLVI